MTAPKKTTGKSLADFKAVYDKNTVIPKKINEGLEKLGDGWETEVEFMKLCGVSNTDFMMFREQFADFYVELGPSSRGKRVWAGTKALAAKMREMV